MINLEKIILILLLAFAILFGFYRDGVKKNTNQEIYYYYAESDYYTLTPSQKQELMSVYNTQIPRIHNWIHQLNFQQLKKSKWIGTGVFTLIYLFITLTIVKIQFKDTKYLIKIVLAYGLTIVISYLVYFLGSYFFQSDASYHFSHRFMGALQSPIPLLLILPSIYLHKKHTSSNI